MPDYPPSILAAATAAIADQFRDDLGKPGMPEPDALARAALDAAAPLLAEAVAAKITEHAERQHPRDPDHVPTAWHRHFSIAARVAAGAFDTREDQLRMAAEAIERGQYIACDIPEVPDAHRAEYLARIAAQRSIPCPSCGAAAGELCRTRVSYKGCTPGYTQSTIHVARKRAAAEDVSASSAATREDGES